MMHLYCYSDEDLQHQTSSSDSDSEGTVSYDNYMYIQITIIETGHFK